MCLVFYFFVDMKISAENLEQRKQLVTTRYTEYETVKLLWMCSICAWKRWARFWAEHPFACDSEHVRYGYRLRYEVNGMSESLFLIPNVGNLKSHFMRVDTMPLVCWLPRINHDWSKWSLTVIAVPDTSPFSLRFLRMGGSISHLITRHTQTVTQSCK